VYVVDHSTDDVFAYTMGFSLGDSLTIAGDIELSKNILWDSGTGFTGTLDHAMTANRTWTFPDSTDTVVGKATTDTFTNKSVDLANNTVTGTTAEFNAALSDDDFATIAGTETLTNKTLTTPAIATITNTGTVTLPTATDTLVARDTTDTLTNKTIDTANNTITVLEADVSDLKSYLLNVLEDTTPQLGGQLDVNGNSIGSGTLEIISFVETGSAVNEITITNAAASGNPSITATGDDTDIGLAITPKGTDALILDGLSWPTADGSPNQVIETDGSGVLSFVAAGSGISNVVEDTTPQLGGMLDVNGNSLGDGTDELLSFVEVGSPINELTITNAAIGNDPSLSATGDDTNIHLNLIAKGTGVVQIEGVEALSLTGTQTPTNKTIDLGDNTLTGSVAEFNTALQSESFATLGGTETLTAKTLTSPIIADIVPGANFTLDQNSVDSMTSVETGALVNTLYMDAGRIFINDTANANMTRGITITSSAIDEQFALKHTTVAHGMTTRTETDTFFVIDVETTTEGGTRIEGYSEADVGMEIVVRATDDVTTKNTSALANFMISAELKTGTTGGAHGANANLVAIRNFGTTRFLFDAEGSGHADVEWVTYSDRRLKSNIAQSPYGLDEVMLLMPIVYDKESGKFDKAGKVVLEGNKRRMLGFSAQEVRALMPELVQPVDESHSFYSMSYGRLTPILWRAMQQQQDMIEDLQRRVEVLERRPAAPVAEASGWLIPTLISAHGVN